MQKLFKFNKQKEVASEEAQAKGIEYYYEYVLDGMDASRYFLCFDGVMEVLQAPCADALPDTLNVTISDKALSNKSIACELDGFFVLLPEGKAWYLMSYIKELIVNTLTFEADKPYEFYVTFS